MTNIFNPLDLHGPAFLVYYAMIGAVVLGTLVLWQRRHEATPATTPAPLSDAHLLAYLRGGEEEPVRLAIVTLIDRGLLEADGRWLNTTEGAAKAHVKDPLEKAVLGYFLSGGGRVVRALEDRAVRAELRRLEDTLIERGLLPTTRQHLARGAGVAAAALALWIVAFAQIANRDPRYGIGFLVLFAFAFTAGAAWISFRRRTAAGDRHLADVRQLLRGSRSQYLARAGAGHVPPLLMAAFGLSLLPATSWAFLHNVLPGARPPREKKEDSHCSAGCGSSGSSVGDGGGASGGDGGGSGCGGGCGGGGCGGCGG